LNDTLENDMPKGEQRSNKMAKKSKKDTTPAKDAPTTSTRPTAPMTSVPLKGKLKNS
jgi:hypothetical protein